MNAEQHDRARALFHEIYDSSPEERAAYLDAHAESPEVRAEVEELLAEHDNITEFLDPSSAPRRPAGAHGDRGLLPTKGDRLGPYTVRRLLGEGGFGAVCEAEQSEPVRRVVALKVLKAGMDTRQIIERFEAERQAIAMMEHRFIAKVFDAGATPGGRPYFVMEYVPGVPITRFCEQRGLDATARLRLFLQVCEAIEHAHQKGIIHRDIKPSNVLVTMQGQRPVPKIIDFGIAKATRPQLGARTSFTEQGQLVGTPAYMSPEQAELGRLDIDTRSDIYSLGALLYELLVGTPLFDPVVLRGKSFTEIQRTLREEEPPRPSARAAALAADPDGEAPQPATPHRELRGDLDWIVLKAISKDRARRYPTVRELAADIERHLALEPVLAGPPSAVYRLGRLVRRHRVAVAAGVLVFATVIGGLGAVLWQRAQAESEADVAATVIQLLGESFTNASAGMPPEERVDLVALRSVDERIREDDTFADQPQHGGRISGWLAYLFRTLDRPADEEWHLRRAIRLRTAALGDHHADTLMSRNFLARLLVEQDRAAEARPLARETLARARRALSPQNPIAIGASTTLAKVMTAIGQHTAAERELQAALAICDRELGAESRLALTTQRELAIALEAGGQWTRAVQLFSAIARHHRDRAGPLATERLTALRDAARVYRKLDQPADAQAALQQVANALRQQYGDDAPPTRRAQAEAAALRAEIQGSAGSEAATPATTEDNAAHPTSAKVNDGLGRSRSRQPAGR